MKPFKLSTKDFETSTQVQADTPEPRQQWVDDRLTHLKSRIKKHYISEQGQTCAYCKANLHTNNGMVWDTEHIIDKEGSPQWMFEPLNLCVACKDCNGAKGNKKVTKNNSYKKFPSKSANYKIIHPHFDDYKQHIKVAVPGAVYLFITEKGQNTIEICGLLRYHKAAGRNKVDLGLKAALLAAASEPSPEMLQYALEEIKRKQAEIAQEEKDNRQFQ